MPGPPRTPTAKLKRVGSWRGKTRKDEPAASGDLPAAPPEWLTEVAQAEYRRIFKLLGGFAGVARSIDVDALCLYCESFATWKEATTWARKQLVGTTKKGGHPMPNPYLPIANAAFDQCRRMLLEFGLTPASRSRVAAATTNAPTANAKTSFFDGE